MTDPRDGDQFGALQEALAGSWSIERELGRGGMGTVYLARDVALDRPVAIKVLHGDLAHDPAERDRFLREARTGARLSHPNIVPIYDVAESGELVWFVMGLVDGESLGSRLRREGPLPADEVERIMGEVAWALAAAHANGILHRDVTVDNILMERRTGRALLADFGIAAHIDGGDTGPLVGTAAYLAPELVHGEPPSPASDLYALGIVGWTSLTGHLPFLDEDPSVVLLRQVTDPIPPLAEAAAGTPSRLARAIESLLAKDPLDRPPDVESWVAVVEHGSVQSRMAEPLRRWAAGRDGIRPFQALAMTTIAVIGAATLAGMNGVSTIGLDLGLRAALLVGVGFAIIHAGAALRALRRAALDGYGVEDLRLALDRHLAERRRRGRTPPTAAGRAIWVLSRLGGAVFASVVAMLLLFDDSWDALPWSVRLFLWEHGAALLRWSWITYWTGLGVNLLLPARALPPVDRRARLRQRFWRTPLAEAWYRLGTILLGAETREPSTLHRPTELVVGLEIDDLWRELPATTRQGLGDLPTTARALRHRIEDIRRLLAQVDDPALPASRETIALRDRLIDRRTAALQALERLRLLVLRLVGASDSPGELTEQLRGARALEAELLMELGAHPEVRRAVGRRSETRDRRSEIGDRVLSPRA